jgi:hypothetical protein
MVPSSGMLAQLHVEANVGDEMASAATETASLILLALIILLS